MTHAQQDIKRKLRILNHAKATENISKTCRYFGIPRDILYRWKRAYEALGESGLINSKPCPENPNREPRLPLLDNLLCEKFNNWILLTGSRISELYWSPVS